MLINQLPSDVNLLDSVPHTMCRSGEVPLVVKGIASIFGAHDVGAPEEATDAPFSQPRDIYLASYSAVEVNLVHLITEVGPSENGQVNVAI